MENPISNSTLKKDAVSILWLIVNGFLLILIIGLAVAFISGYL